MNRKKLDDSSLLLMGGQRGVQNIPILGMGQWIGFTQHINDPPAPSNTTAIAATGNKASFNGRVWTPNGGKKNIQSVTVLLGNLIKTGNSGLICSLQDVDQLNGTPIRPDGTMDQSIGFNISTMTGSAQFTTPNFNAVRSVNYGDLLSTVFEYDAGGRLGTDTFQFSGIGGNNASGWTTIPSTHLITGTWGVDAAALPNIIFNFDDGTFGTFFGAIPFSSNPSNSLNSGSTPNEAGLGFRVNSPIIINGCSFVGTTLSNAANFNVNFYIGTRLIWSVPMNAKNLEASAIQSTFFVTFPPTTLAPGNNYVISIQPTSTNAFILYSLAVSNQNHLSMYPGGLNFNFVSRLNGANWTVTNTQRPVISLHLSAIGG